MELALKPHTCGCLDSLSVSHTNKALQEPEKRKAENLGKSPLLPELSPLCPLLTQINIEQAGKREIVLYQKQGRKSGFGAERR